MGEIKTKGSMLLFIFRCFHCDEKLLIIFLEGQDGAAKSINCPKCSKTWGFIAPTFEIIEVVENIHGENGKVRN